MNSELTALVNRLETVATRLEGIADFKGQPNTNNDTMASFVIAYDEIVNGPFCEFLKLSSTIGGDVAKQSQIVASAFKAQRAFLVTSSNSREPPQNTLMTLLQPTSDCIIAIQEFREKNRASVFFNHLSAVSESIPALGWVTVSPAPSPFVKEMSDASQFYANRVLKDYKDKDKIHIDWVRAWLQVLGRLQAYIKEFHTTGLSWNAKGNIAPTPQPIRGPPVGGFPPPPPPPPPPADLFSASGDMSDDARAALFKEINKGQDITKGLKRVTADQQTHKNPTLRQAPAPYKPPPSIAPRPFKPVIASSGPIKPCKPPRFELEGKKWCVDYQNMNKDIVIAEPEMNQSICVYQCNNCLIQVNGKVNSITLDSCKKTSIVFGDIVSVVEFINCQSMQCQTTGKVPTITVDKADGVQIFLSDKSRDVEIVSSKSSEINVSVPQKNGDYVEYPVPEQFKSTITNKGLHTEVIEKA